MKDEKRAFDVAAHWRERGEQFRKAGNHGAAQYCDTHAHTLDVTLKRKNEREGEENRIYAEEIAARVRKSFDVSAKKVSK